MYNSASAVISYQKLKNAFLALLENVSRAHEIELRPSVRRPSVASIISEVTAWIDFKFQLWLPLGHMPRRFFSFLKTFFF